MRILVDMDGIITDTLPVWLDRIHYHTGIHVSPDEIVKWNLNENPPLNILQPNKIFDILNEESFTINIPPMFGAPRVLQLLYEDGHDISIVTARYGDRCMPETIHWLKEWMPWFNAEKKAWFCYDKHRISGDVLIDDKAETLIKYSQEHPKTKLVTINYPYNQHAPSNTFRVAKDENSWDEIYKYIRDLQQAQRP